jgi:hypothetical protein
MLHLWTSSLGHATLPDDNCQGFEAVVSAVSRSEAAVALREAGFTDVRTKRLASRFHGAT